MKINQIIDFKVFFVVVTFLFYLRFLYIIWMIQIHSLHSYNPILSTIWKEIKKKGINYKEIASYQAWITLVRDRKGAPWRRVDNSSGAVHVVDALDDVPVCPSAASAVVVRTCTTAAAVVASAALASVHQDMDSVDARTLDHSSAWSTYSCMEFCPHWLSSCSTVDDDWFWHQWPRFSLQRAFVLGVVLPMRPQSVSPYSAMSASWSSSKLVWWSFSHAARSDCRQRHVCPLAVDIYRVFDGRYLPTPPWWRPRWTCPTSATASAVGPSNLSPWNPSIY